MAFYLYLQQNTKFLSVITFIESLSCDNHAITNPPADGRRVNRYLSSMSQLTTWTKIRITKKSEAQWVLFYLFYKSSPDQGYHLHVLFCINLPVKLKQITIKHKAQTILALWVSFEMTCVVYLLIHAHVILKVECQHKQFALILLLDIMYLYFLTICRFNIMYLL